MNNKKHRDGLERELPHEIEDAFARVRRRLERLHKFMTLYAPGVIAEQEARMCSYDVLRIMSAWDDWETHEDEKRRCAEAAQPKGKDEQ